MWVFADSIDLLLEPLLLLLDPLFDNPWKLFFEYVKTALGHRQELFANLERVDFDHSNIL